MVERPTDTRPDFPHLAPVQTRWADNDIYGHINNVVYYAYFDTVINDYLIKEGGLDVRLGSVIGVCVESQCRYLESAAYPEKLDAGLRVTKLGNSSVTYEIGIFRAETLCALGAFVHVFVDAATRRPSPIPDRIRSSLERIRRSP